MEQLTKNQAVATSQEAVQNQNEPQLRDENAHNDKSVHGVLNPTYQAGRSEERFSRNAETDLVCRLLLEKKKHPQHLSPRPQSEADLPRRVADAMTGAVCDQHDVGWLRTTEPAISGSQRRQIP